MRCVQCGSIIPDKALFCSVCGHIVEKPPTPEDGSETSAKEDQESLYDVEEQKDQEEQEEQKPAVRAKAENANLSLWITLAVILFLAAVVLVISAYMNSKETQNDSSLSASTEAQSVVTEAAAAKTAQPTAAPTAAPTQKAKSTAAPNDQLKTYYDNSIGVSFKYYKNNSVETGYADETGYLIYISCSDGGLLIINIGGSFQGHDGYEADNYWSQYNGNIVTLISSGPISVGGISAEQFIYSVRAPGENVITSKRSIFFTKNNKDYAILQQQELSPSSDKQWSAAFKKEADAVLSSLYIK